MEGYIVFAVVYLAFGLLFGSMFAFDGKGRRARQQLVDLLTMAVIWLPSLVIALLLHVFRWVVRIVKDE